MAIALFLGSSAVITATLTDPDNADALVDDATTTIAITNKATGASVLAATGMTGTGGGAGTYTYTVAASLLSEALYVAEIIAVKSSLTREANVMITVTRDET